MRTPWQLLIAGLAAAPLACNASPHSGAGFRLPAGDVEHGKQVFIDMQCHACHHVAGVPGLPEPVASPPVPVVLGGEVPHVKTDGELLTSIINPSHKIAPGFRETSVKIGDSSRMVDYGDVMTVRQLVDLVAFLQSRYVVVRPGRPGQ
jgi:mono/diheme cytochrome c family protein